MSEPSARARKVAKLAATIDAINANNALQALPMLSATALAVSVASQTPEWWDLLARLAKVRTPSETTRAAVIAVFRERAAAHRLLREISD